MQKEAILNEWKGNLFEFLVTQGLAAKCSLESDFLFNLPAEFKSKLGSYEELMRTHEPKLLIKLPVLAQKTVEELWRSLDLGRYNFSQWNVIGKMVATNDSELWNETDIVGSYSEDSGERKKLALSLKLTKDHSYINTKSAGVKSFLSKYFDSFDSAKIELMQQNLNHEVDESFLAMGHRLYQLADLEFKGAFDSRWSDQYSELPGELEPAMRQIVHENYHRVALKLSGLLHELKITDEQLFFESLYALCGFGHADIVQVNCFHQDYELSEVTIKSFEDIFKSSNKVCALMPIKDMASSVEVVMGAVTLQIRVKPMNKFTTAAYKINCSIKVKA
ncbi:MAG: hypothetical protein WC635_14810 [Bacteriovorax sp.]